MKAELDPLRPRLVRPPAPEPQRVEGQRELGEIVAHVWENAEKLVRQELELGLAELSVRTDKLKQSLLSAAIAGAALFAGLLVLLAAAVLGLSNAMEPWLAALIVGAVVTTVGVLLMKRGKSKAEQAVTPDSDHTTARLTKEATK